MLEIKLRQRAATLREGLEMRKLSQTDRGRDIGQIRFGAPMLDVKVTVGEALDALEAKLLERARVGLVREDETSTLARRQILVCMEAERDEISEAADPPPPVARTKRLRGILDHAQVETRCDSVQRIAIDG